MSIATFVWISIRSHGFVEQTLRCGHAVRKLRLGCQLFGPLLFADSITQKQPRYADFHLQVPRGPGYGMRIDEDKWAFYRRDGGKFRRT